MSQVKKLQAGGSNPPTGKFRMNGRELVGQTAIDRLSAVYGRLPLDEREMFTVAQRAILEGNTAEYDPTNNTITVLDQSGNAITDKYTSTKARTTNSGFKKWFGANFNDEAHRFKKSGEAMALVDMTDPSEVKKAVAELTDLRRGYGWFYDKDKDGNYVYNEGPKNADRLSIIDQIAGYYNDENPDTLKDRYSTKNWPDADLIAFRNYYAGLTPDQKASYWGTLKDKIKKNTLSDVDKETLRLFGFSDKDVESQADNATSDNGLKIHKDWAGNHEAAKNQGVGIDFRDGAWYITGNPEFTDQNWYLGGWDFVKGTPFENGFSINGRLISLDEALNNPGQYKAALAKWFAARGKNYRDAYDTWANSGFRFINDRVGHENDETPYYGVFENQWNPQVEYAKFWQNYFAPKGNHTYDYNVLTQNYNNIGKKRVMSYIDPKRRNAAGMFLPKFVVYDYDDKEHRYKEYDDEASMLSALGLTKADPYGTVSKMDVVPWGDYNDNAYAVFGSFGPEVQQNTLWIDRNTGHLWIGRKGPNNEIEDPKMVGNYEKLLEILNNPTKKYTNADIEDLYQTTQVIPEFKQHWYEAIPIIGPVANGIVNLNDWAKAGYFQYGGTLDVATTNVKKGPAIEESQTDITKAHKINGEDGGLTEAEWMQIGAAAGDLAGVAATFIPGVGNIVGAGLGVAASTTKFVADIKQDGYQGSDLKNFGINLLLDAATLIPIAGTWAATSKAVKVIRGIGKPLLKLLAISNAGAATINAAQKIINGDDWTSADVTKTIQGLASMGVVGATAKSRFNSAKLAKKVEAKAIENANKTLSKPKVGSAGGYEMKKSPAELQEMLNGKTQPEAIKIVQDAAKAEKGIDLAEADAKKILKDFDIKFDVKGKRAIKLPWKRGAFKRGESTTDYQAPQAEQPKSVMHYFLRGKDRAKMLGSEYVYGFPVKNTNAEGLFGKFRQKGNLGLLSREEVTEAIGNVAAGKGSAADKALARISATTPQAFGTMFSNKGIFNPIKSSSDWTFGGNRYYRIPTKIAYTTPAGIKDKILMLPAHVRNPYTVPAIGQPRILNSNIINPELVSGPISGTPHSIYTFGNAPRVGFTTPAFNPNYSVQFWKKGGKIIKGSEGLGDISKYYKKPEDLDFVKKTMELLNAAPTSSTTITPINRPGYTTLTKPDLKLSDETRAILDNKKLDYDTSIFDDNMRGVLTNKSKSGTDVGYGGFLGKKTNINWANVDDLMRAGVSVAAINKDRRIQKDAINKLKQRQFQTPLAERVKYDFSDINQGFNNQAQPLIDSRYVTSDSRDSMAFNLAKAQKLAELENQRRAAITARINETDQQNRQIDYSNTLNRVNTANQKSQYNVGLNYQDRMIDSAALNNIFSHVINPLGQQFSQQGREARDMMLKQTYQRDLKDAQTREDARINAELTTSGWRAKWNNLNATEKARYNNITDYIYVTDPEAYKKIFSPSPMIIRDSENATRNYARATGASLFYKKGGSIRSAQDQIAINSDRDAKKASAKLTDHLMRMLQQLIK